MGSDALYVPAPLIAGLIETLTTNNGWTVEQLAARSQISIRTISRITNGDADVIDYNTADSLISRGLGRPDLFGTIPTVKRDVVIDQLKATIAARDQTIRELLEGSDRTKQRYYAASIRNRELKAEVRNLRARLRHAIRELAR